MGDNLQLRAATVGDEQTLAALLSAEGLPAAEFAERSTHFEVIDDGDAVIAAAGLESHGAAALLRSVVVAPAHRGRGLARRLTELMVERARDLGHESLYLLTMDADAYFAFVNPYRHYPVADTGDTTLQGKDERGRFKNDGPLDIQLAVSRDGITFARPDRKPYVPLGMAGAWDDP